MSTDYARPAPTDGVTYADLMAGLTNLPDKYELWTVDQHRYPHGQVSFDQTIIVYKSCGAWRYARASTWPVGTTLFSKRVSRATFEEHLRTFMYKPVEQKEQVP